MANFPVEQIDASKFLHMINVGAQAKINIFEERVKAMGKEIGANWQLASIDRSNILIEDTNDNVYYHGSIEELGHGRVKITNIRKLKITESKKEGNFKKNVLDMVESVTKDDLKGADEAFNRLACQRFRGSVIPENGHVVTKDGIIRKVNKENCVVERKDQAKLVKSIAEELKNGVKVNRGGIVEAVYDNKQITIPISEITRRKAICHRLREEIAKKAYLSPGFQSRVQHVAQLFVEEKLQEAVDCAAGLFADADKKEFCLLNKKEMQELVSNALASKCCFNKSLAEDVGTLMYKTNCRVNREDIIEEFSKMARMSEHVPLVENVRRLKESEEFDVDYDKFLNALFSEDKNSLNIEAAANLCLLRNVQNILTNCKDKKEELDQVTNYVTQLESRLDNVDHSLMMEVRNLLGALSEEVINGALALNQYAENQNPGMMSGFDQAVNQTSNVDPAMFGGNTNLGGIGGGGATSGLGDLGLGGEGGMPGAEAGAGGPAMPGDMDNLGGDKNLGAGLEAGLGAEGGVGGAEQPAPEEAPGAEANPFKAKAKKPGAPALMAAGLERSGKPIAEDESFKKFMAGRKKKSDDGGETGTGSGTPPCEDGTCPKEDVQRIRSAVGQLDTNGLKSELMEWRKNAGKFFKEDGSARATVQLRAYIDQANALNESAIAKAFKDVLYSNTPVNSRVEIVDDPYAYNVKMEDLRSDFGLGKMKESPTGLPGKGSKAPTSGKDEPMGSAEDKKPNAVVTNPSATFKGGKKTIDTSVKMMESIVCPACKSKHGILECLKDNGYCPSCGNDVNEVIVEATASMESPDGKGVAATGLKKSDGTSAVGGKGSKVVMDSPDGKGVVKANPKKSDGASAPSGKGKTDAMDGQEGKPISGGVKGEVKESSLKGPTRKNLNFPGAKDSRNSVAEDIAEADKAVALIAEAMGDDLDMSGDTPDSEPAPDMSSEPAPDMSSEPAPDMSSEPAPDAGADIESPPDVEAGLEGADAEVAEPPVGDTDMTPDGVGADGGEQVMGKVTGGVATVTPPVGVTEIVVQLPEGGGEIAPPTEEPISPELPEEGAEPSIPEPSPEASLGEEPVSPEPVSPEPELEEPERPIAAEAKKRPNTKKMSGKPPVPKGGAPGKPMPGPCPSGKKNC